MAGGVLPLWRRPATAGGGERRDIFPACGEARARMRLNQAAVERGFCEAVVAGCAKIEQQDHPA